MYELYGRVARDLCRTMLAEGLRTICTRLDPIHAVPVQQTREAGAIGRGQRAPSKGSRLAKSRKGRESA
jgi:hypothetical protein